MKQLLRSNAQNLDTTRQGALATLRVHVLSLAPSTSTNMRSQFLKKVYATLLPINGSLCLTALDDFLLTAAAAHVAGMHVTKKNDVPLCRNARL